MSDEAAQALLPLEKRCKKCGEIKPLTAYTPAKDGRCGCVAECRPCRNERTKRYFAANADKVRASKRRRYDPVKAREVRRTRRQRDRERLREWRAANPSLNRRYQQRAREQHPERYREYRRKYYYDGNEKAKCAERGRRRRRLKPQDKRLSQARRRAIKRKVGGKVSQRDATRLLNRLQGRCAYCPRQADTFDHVVPLIRGGRHTIGNLLPACRACNSSKHKWLLIEWRVRRGLAPIS
jgi:hypothetical protein